MIDTIASPSAPTPCKKIFCMRTNDRMAGSVPVWEGRKSAIAQVEQDLSAASTTTQSENLPATALGYKAEGSPTYHAASQPAQEFGFADILDMINPLQHIPLVSNIYRQITGDEIKPASRLIGGAVFGGVVGVASGLANIIMEEETGHDMPGTVLAMLDEPSAPPAAPTENPINNIETASLTTDSQTTEELPASLLGFTANSYPLPTAQTHNLMPLPNRTPITQVTLSPLPLLQEENKS